MDITIFLASSSELKDDRAEFTNFIALLNESWRDRNIHFILNKWENFIDVMSKDGLQEEYNKAAEGCDIFVMLFFTKVGKYTSEEFEAAYKRFKSNEKPLIFTFFKEDIIYTSQINDQLTTLLEFKKKLVELEHYPTIYKNMGDLQWQLTWKLEELCNKRFLISNNIKKLSNRAEIDSRTIENVCKLLSPQTDDRTIEELVVQLQELIRLASDFAKTAVFQLAKVNRRSNRNTDRILMARSIPIFEVLINSNKRKDKHYYFGQLAYALKDKDDGDYENALENFNIAIDIRDNFEPEYFYEFNRAICKVQNDSNFKSGASSDVIIRNQILQDLKYSKSGLGVKLEKIIEDETDNRVLIKWFKLNSVDFNTL
ncbi:MAG: hypothetical protein E6Q62_04310 [Nitrosomonas sp.]|nr:MAG: hypothetical protein E6Q62_04310 [Nitrosomonas sp.]